MRLCSVVRQAAELMNELINKILHYNEAGKRSSSDAEGNGF
jgi:hypothetical protein